jgi:hypothetical protein
MVDEEANDLDAVTAYRPFTTVRAAGRYRRHRQRCGRPPESRQLTKRKVCAWRAPQTPHLRGSSEDLTTEHSLVDSETRFEVTIRAVVLVTRDVETRQHRRDFRNSIDCRLERDCPKPISTFRGASVRKVGREGIAVLLRSGSWSFQS